jgi:hypothetical protein
VPNHAIAKAESPEGRLVKVESRAWNHVIGQHPEMELLLDQVVRTIERPDHREPDIRPGRERLFARLPTGRWLR